MNTRFTFQLIRRTALLLLFLTLNSQLSPAFAQGTGFTYQGRFNTNGTPYTGAAEFQFTLWDALSGGSAVATNNPPSVVATVADGLFTATLDFGSNPFNGQPRFLQIEARTSIGLFTTLNPRQPVTPTPYALRALNLATNGLAEGNYGNAVTFNNTANSFNGTFTGNGGGLNNVNALTLGGVAAAGFWRTTGNAGTSPGANFLGTTDTNALEFKVNGQRALRIEHATNSSSSYSPNMVGGHPNNIVSNGFVGAVIGGGGLASFNNRVGDDFATVVGGLDNTASGFASTAMGDGNIASGLLSTAMGYNTMATGVASTAMGRFTTANGNSSTAMGLSTTASGLASIALGNGARALHDGTFVWSGSDANTPYFASTTNEQFSVRARGGVRLSDNTPALSFGSTTRQMINLLDTEYGIGVQTGTMYFRSDNRFSWFRDGSHSNTQNDPGGGVVAMTLTSSGLTVNGVVVSSSDRQVKAGFTAVDPKAILEKVAALSIQRWHFTNDAGTRHLGPMAQDFHAAFGIGADDKHIATVDADGVALAAIQGLNQKLAEELKRRDAENTELKQRLTALERIIRGQKSE